MMSIVILFGKPGKGDGACFCSLSSNDMLGVAECDMFACGKRGGKYANINPRNFAHAVRSRAKGTYRARGILHANEM